MEGWVIALDIGEIDAQKNMKEDRKQEIRQLFPAARSGDPDSVRLIDEALNMNNFGCWFLDGQMWKVHSKTESCPKMYCEDCCTEFSCQSHFDHHRIVRCNSNIRLICEFCGWKIPGDKYHWHLRNTCPKSPNKKDVSSLS